MRNQYKVLNEKYELVNEGLTKLPLSTIKNFVGKLTTLPHGMEFIKYWIETFGVKRGLDKDFPALKKLLSQGDIATEMVYQVYRISLDFEMFDKEDKKTADKNAIDGVTQDYKEYLKYLKAAKILKKGSDEAGVNLDI